MEDSLVQVVGQPAVYSAEVTRLGEVQTVAAKFLVDRRLTFLERLPLAFRTFWQILTGRLQWAVFARFNPKSHG